MKELSVLDKIESKSKISEFETINKTINEPDISVLRNGIIER